MTNQYQLVMLAGPTPGKVFSFTENELSIGRDINNQIVINDAEVSRQHCFLIAQAGGYVLQDNSSTNGSYVNGVRVHTSQLLQVGDTIKLGETISFKYESTSADPAATVLSRDEARNVAPPPPIARNIPAPPPAPSYTPPQVATPAAHYSPPVAPQKGKSNSGKVIMIGCGVLLVIGICVVAVGLWYVDSNFLWCDVFGSLIPACAP
ncbi:MAG: FHA domain-containing protein [Anaerolineales bacterium]|nr:FHA domain-containing protein [Anaerolineales bacterium]